MKFIQLFLRFRLLQLWRMLRSIGWLLVLLVMPMLVVFFLSFLNWLRETDIWLAVLVVFGMLLSIHFQRPDKQWLSHFSFKKWQLFLLEYSFFMLPLSLSVLFFFQDYVLAGMFHLAAVLVSFLPDFSMKKHGKNSFLNLNKIPLEAFEWRIGLRRFFPLILLYFAGFFVARYVAGVPVIVVILMWIGTSFYEDLEPKELLEASLFKGNLLKTIVTTI